MTEPDATEPAAPRPTRAPVPRWVVLGTVGVFFVLSGLITYLGSLR